MRKRQLLPLTLITMLAAFQGMAQEKWDLKKCVEYAVTNNISIKQAILDSKVAEVNLKQSRMGQLPTLGFNSGQQWGFGRTRDFATQEIVTQNSFGSSYGLQTGVTLFNWFSSRYNTKGSALEVEATREDVNALRYNTSLSVAAAYLDALLAIEQRRVADVQLELTKSQLENTRKLVEAGSLPELSAAELEAQVARDTSAVVSAYGAVNTSILQLKALMNLDVATPFELAVPPVDQIPLDPIGELQPDLVYNIAVDNQPSQKSNKLRLQSVEYYTKAAKASLWPTISASGGISTQYFSLYRQMNSSGQIEKVPYMDQLSENIAENIGIGINIPLFQGYALKGNYQKAVLNTKNIALQLEQVNFNLKRDIYQAYVDATTALEKYNAQKKAVETSQKTYEFSKKRYEVGLLNTIDLIIAQNNFSSAKINLLSAQFEYVFKMKVLEFYKGQGLKL
ncbi:MAG: TolC family protein [Chitinophagaceae bacterium]